jgi:fatty acid desaturase
VLRLVLPYRKPQRMLGPVVLWTVSGVVLYEVSALWILGVWALSLFTSFWAVSRVRAFTEHVSLSWSGKETSHRFSAGYLTRFFFFPHNTWCHYEHHKWPQVPFYNLPKLRKLDTGKRVLRLHELFPLR